MIRTSGRTRAVRLLLGTTIAVTSALALVAGPAGAALPTAPSTERTSAGAGTGSAELPAMTSDGTLEVFVGRGEGNAGVWLKNRATDAAYHLTTSMDFNPDISADGTTVAFVRYGSDRQVYVMDVSDPANPGTPVLASVSSAEVTGDGLSDFPSLNADGSVIAFQSTSENLDPTTPLPTSGGPNKVYVRDLGAGTTAMVSVDNAGVAQPGNAIKPDLDSTGRYVAFAGEADLSGPVASPTAAPGGEEEPTTTFQQIWVRDRVAESTTAASVSSDGVVGDAAAGLVYGPSISADGKTVAFESDATNLVPADTNGRTDAFVHDMTNGSTSRVSERTPTTETGAFHAVTPVRLLDTRVAPEVKVAPGETVDLAVAGVAGVPVDAAAVALNITVTEPTDAGFLTAFPTGTVQPATSTLNWNAGWTVPNAATVKIGANGSISFFNQNTSSVHLVIDLSGWYDDAQVAGGGFIAMQPTRVLDTRITPGTPVGPGESITVPVTGGAVPADATAVALSVTVTEPTAAGFLTVHPTGSDLPTASNLNFLAGQTLANSVLVAPGPDGTVTIFNQVTSSTHIVVDVNGWFDAALPNGGFTSVDPVRALDTRSGSPIGPQSTRSVPVLGVGAVPAMQVTAVALNITVTEPSAGTYVTAFPTGTILPTASNINVAAGETRAVQVLAQVGADGQIDLYNSVGTTHAVVDITGWYSGVQVSEGGQGAAVSGDGSHVAFESFGSTMTAGDVNGVIDAFVRDLDTPLTERVSVVDEGATGATEATGTRVDGHTGEVVPQKNGADVAINLDGSMVAFTSNGNLAGDRTVGEETPGEISTESAVFTRTRS